METLKRYYQLAKPGIIYGNLISTIGGFFLASRGHFPVSVFLGAVIGISLVMASGCVFNNCIDRDIDARMARTKKRALVTGAISVRNALIYGTMLGLSGTAILALLTNPLAASAGVLGWFTYVVVYGYFKRRSVHGTLIGSIPGAMPALVGYLAVSNAIDGGALILFLIVAIWQMPHSYGIAMYRLHDYTEAGIPVLPAVKGMRAAKVQSLLYIIAFLVAACSLTFYGYTGYIYLAVMALLSLNWVRIALMGYNDNKDAVWGRKVFLFSLVILTAFGLIVSLGPIIP